jgi:hypothetical protein
VTKQKPEALNDSDSIAWQDTNCERNETSLSVLALFQELLRAARLRRRISTAMLAERAFISRATLYRAERGNPRSEHRYVRHHTLGPGLGRPPRRPCCSLPRSRWASTGRGTIASTHRPPPSSAPAARAKAPVSEQAVYVHAELGGAMHFVGRVGVWHGTRDDHVRV